METVIQGSTLQTLRACAAPPTRRERKVMRRRAGRGTWPVSWVPLGIVGYTMGGGFRWLGRKYGFNAA
jgi:hypothetical protein